MTYGTSHFTSRRAALAYYRPYGTDAAGVDAKLAEGAIHIGPPAIKPGGRLSVIPGEGRYQVEEGI